MKLAILFLAVGALCGATNLGFFSVNPSSSFLELAPTDTCAEFNVAGCSENPTFINLTTLGVTPGTALTMTDIGGLCVYLGPNCTVYPASGGYLGAIFSSTDTLLGPSNLVRVPDALAPGAGATLIGNNPNLYALAGNINTTIPDDFYSGNPISTTVIVPTSPTGTIWLIVATIDSAFADNSLGTSPNYGVELSVPNPCLECSVTPEPSSFFMVLFAFAIVLVFNIYLRNRVQENDPAPYGTEELVVNPFTDEPTDDYCNSNDLAGAVDHSDDLTFTIPNTEPTSQCGLITDEMED